MNSRTSMPQFMPNMTIGPCMNCNSLQSFGPEDFLFCGVCRRLSHILCVNSSGNITVLKGDNFFSYTCNSCSGGGSSDVVTRPRMSLLHLLLLIYYNLHRSKPQLSEHGHFHYRSHAHSFIMRMWSHLYPPHMDTKKERKRLPHSAVSGLLSHYPQYFAGSKERRGWYSLVQVLPPARLLCMYQGQSRCCKRQLEPREVIPTIKSTSHNLVEGAVSATSLSGSSPTDGKNDTSSHSPWFVEKDFMKLDLELPESILEDDDAIDCQLGRQPDQKHKQELLSHRKDEEVDIENCCGSISDVVTEGKADTCKTDVIDTKEEPMHTVSLFTHNSSNESSLKRNSPPEDFCFRKSSRLRKLSAYDEKQLFCILERKSQSGPLPSELYRLWRKLTVRKAKLAHNVPLLDVDAEMRCIEQTGHLRTSDRVKAEHQQYSGKMDITTESRILDRFQIASKPDYCQDAGTDSFRCKLLGLSASERSFIFSPYSLRNLKPVIFRDYECTPLKLKLLQEIQEHYRRKHPGTSLPRRHPIDFCYVTPSHIPAMNQMAQQFFWPGIDLSETLHYPDHTCVAVYGHLVIAFGIIVPDTSYNESYISFLVVHPEWRMAGIAKFMLYHLIQTCAGKDITLHVAADNPALIMYQKFGFKVEEYLMNFYDKYYPEDSGNCKHAMFMRLRR